MRAAALTVLAVLLLSAAAHAALQERRYTAWTPDGEPKLKRYIHGSAECSGASLVNDRPDAWRCVSGTVALDPCFLSPTDDEVMCVGSPWARSGFLLSAVMDPADHGQSRARGPWALRAGGRRCVQLPPTRRKRGRTYRCGGGAFLLGRPRKRGGSTTIRVVRRGASARRVSVTLAWN